MFKKAIVIIGILGLFVSPGYAERPYDKDYVSSDTFTPEESLSILDEGSHFPGEFRSLVEGVCLEHPGYRENEVVHLMISAYQAVQKNKPDITMYGVAKDVRRFSKDELGIDLRTYIAAYVRSQAR